MIVLEPLINIPYLLQTLAMFLWIVFQHLLSIFQQGMKELKCLWGLSFLSVIFCQSNNSLHINSPILKSIQLDNNIVLFLRFRVKDGKYFRKGTWHFNYFIIIVLQYFDQLIQPLIISGIYDDNRWSEKAGPHGNSYIQIHEICLVSSYGAQTEIEIIFLELDLPVYPLYGLHGYNFYFGRDIQLSIQHVVIHLGLLLL